MDEQIPYDREDDSWKGEHLLFVPRPPEGQGGPRGGGLYRVGAKSPKKKAADRRAKVRALIADGFGPKHIAETIGATTSTVRFDAGLMGLEFKSEGDQ